MAQVQLSLPHRVTRNRYTAPYHHRFCVVAKKMCSALAPQPAPKAHTPDAIGGNKGQMCDLDAKRVS